MFENLTGCARNVIHTSSREVERLRHEIDTEHLLLALIKSRCNGSLILESMDVDLRKIYLEIEKMVKTGSVVTPQAACPLAPRAKKVLDYAGEESTLLGYDLVGTEHLLLGFMREHDGVAATVLRSLNVKIEKIREAICSRLQTIGIDETETSEGEMPGASDNLFPKANMTDITDRLTKRARSVLITAYREAYRFGHDYVGTEHVLLAMMIADDSIAANVLKKMGTNLPKIQREFGNLVAPGTVTTDQPDMKLSERMHNVMEHAINESRGLSHNYVGTEHILLGLISDVDCVAVQMLMNQELDPSRVRQELLVFLEALPHQA